MKAMQVRSRINGNDWIGWQWLDEWLSWTYGEPFIKTIRLEFRWHEYNPSTPTFVTIDDQMTEEI